MEQVVAFYLHMTNFDRKEITAQGRKLHMGVLNNNPEHLPELDVRAIDKRRALRSFGVPKSLSEISVVKAPAINREAFKVFCRRLTCALYYMHLGQVMPRTHVIGTFQTQIIDRRADGLIEYAKKHLPDGVVGSRQNTSLGDQFLYLWHGDEAGEMFTFVAQLANSSYFVGVAYPAGAAIEPGADAAPHSADFP
jgi:hypothetical protein